MKQLSMLSRILALFVLIGFFTACDPVEEADPPIVSLENDVDVISSDATVASQSKFKVRLSAIKGTNEMNSLTILEDGVALSTDRYTIDGVVDNNPKLLFDGERSEFTYDIEVTAHLKGTATYAFRVADAGDVSADQATLDITIDPATTGPSVSYSGDSFINLTEQSFLELNINVEKGGSPISTIAVYEDGVIIADNTRLRYKDFGNDFADNPYNVPVEDIDGFMHMIWLRTHSTEESKVYTITVTDEDGGEGSAVITVSLESDETPITIEYTNVKMYNDAGLNGGAIDLNTGTNVSSTLNTGDIVDLGIDGNMNWKRQIEASNGATIKALAVGELLTYLTIDTKEKLQAVFDAGIELSETGTLVVGSTYTAEADGELFIFTIASVNNTTGDNLDYFEVNIKKAE